MNKTKAEAAQEKIIKVTTQLIKEYGDINKITIRDIANKAEVGIGLINYHFQTKENLIELCILKIISKFLEGIEEMYHNLEMSPIDKLKHMYKAKCDFVVSYPGISKISILLDLNSSGLNGNTDQAAKANFQVLKEIYGDRKTDSELFIILHTLMSSFQFAFLRSDVFKAQTGIDFYDKEQRERFINLLIDTVIGTL